MADCLAHVLLAALIALAWVGAGAVVLARARPGEGAALALLNRFGGGAIVFALGTFALGYLHLLYAEVMTPLTAAAAVVGAVAVARTLRGTRLPRLGAWPRWQQAVLALIVLFAVLDVVATCAPITSADALYHHAASAKLFEDEHRIVEMPWAWNSYQPYTVEMLVLDGFLLWDSIQGAFAPLLLALGSVAAVGLGATREFGRSVGLLAAAILFVNAFAVWLATSTFVEFGFLLFFALAGWNAVRFVRADRGGALVLAGVFAGGAAGVKYPAAVAAVMFAAAAGVVARRQLTVRRVLLFAVPAVAVALPWYLKNWIVTGNPFYPLVFGGLNPEAEAAREASFERYGFGTSPADLALLPFRLLVDAEPFDRGEFASPLLLIFAPLALLVPQARRWVIAILAAGLVLVLGWFFGSQHVRFLAPIAVYFSVLAALGILALTRAGRLGRLVAVATTAGAFAAATGIALVYAGQFVPVALGRESRAQFLREEVSYEDGTDWLSRNLPPDAHVALGHILGLYVDRPYVLWTSDILPTTAGPAETRAFARRYGLTHAAVLASNRGARAKQLRYLRARSTARVPVRTIVSRTRSEYGPPDTLLVYRLGLRRPRS